MNKTQVHKLKTHYSELRLSILNSLSKDDEVDVDGDEIDRIQGDALAQMAQRLSSRDLEKLNLIENALVAISDGSINECEECGEAIGEKRLMAIPGVRVCITCAEEAENNAKMFA